MNRELLKGLLPNSMIYPRETEIQSSKVRTSLEIEQRKAALMLIDWLQLETKSFAEIVTAGHALGYLRARSSGWIEKVSVPKGDGVRLTIAGSLVLRELEVNSDAPSKA